MVSLTSFGTRGGLILKAGATLTVTPDGAIEVRNEKGELLTMRFLDQGSITLGEQKS